jgi:catechol 2,3-dioxygenase
LFHFAIVVPDRAALGRFLGHLAGLGVYAGSADHAVSEALYLTDPDGLGIEVYADRPRTEWRTAGQELFMTTEPLDLRGLLRAGGDTPWTGMPPGTRMGHVHLHVGDLEAAAAFYHAGLGLDRVVWSYPGALFLAAGGYHHHLGTNTWARGAVPARDDDARLLEWELVLPDASAVAEAARSLESSGFATAAHGDGRRARDPWGTQVALRAATAAR